MANKSCFELKAFQDAFEAGSNRKDLVFLARTAESAERYSDMCQFMRALVEFVHAKGDFLTIEERNLLSVAYKNEIGARRASWRTLNGVQERPQNDSLLDEYKEQVKSELKAISDDVLDLLENKLLKNDKCTEEARVFYLKMTADYCRYLSEFANNEDHGQKAARFYKDAYEIAKEKLEPTHPIRLGLALNYSVCHYEILKDKKAACDLAKSSFDDAISKLDQLDEASYKDSTLIMQLLRDNLTLWTSDDNNNDEDVQVEDFEADQ